MLNMFCSITVAESLLFELSKCYEQMCSLLRLAFLKIHALVIIS